jgi:hypothetical protein
VLRVPPNITRLTQQRLVDLGVSLDIVSMSTPPRHVVPLFLLQVCACVRARSRMLV